MIKIKRNANAIKIKKKKIPAKIRTAIIIILGIMTLASVVNVVATSSQETTTIEKNIPICNYNNQGLFNYVVFLQDNTVYETKVLYPGQATIFKKITDHMDATFSYKFDSDCQSTLQGSYKLIYDLQTNVWNKKYITVPKTIFDTKNFTINFEINTTYYENIIKTINEETGVPAQNPTLNITCEITINAQTDNGKIIETFSPKISIPLNENIIEINGDLTQTKTGILEKTIETTETKENNQNGSIVTAALFFIPIIPIALFTENNYTKLSETEKQLKKTMKKYDEWIVETNKTPRKTIGSETIQMKTLDDLVKTSEELGKPIIYYTSKIDNTHTFHVIDNTTYYEYILTEDTKK